MNLLRLRSRSRFCSTRYGHLNPSLISTISYLIFLGILISPCYFAACNLFELFTFSHWYCATWRRHRQAALGFVFKCQCNIFSGFQHSYYLRFFAVCIPYTGAVTAETSLRLCMVVMLFGIEIKHPTLNFIMSGVNVSLLFCLPAMVLIAVGIGTDTEGDD